MFNGKRILAVIPARGGSKRAPRKNIALFRGKPLIEWTLHAAYDSLLVDSIAFSTEDLEIYSHVRRNAWGVHLVMRPPELATDDAMNEDVLRHVLSWEDNYDEVVLLQPTSPLRTGQDIDDAIASAGRPLISVNELGHKNGAIYIASAEWLREGRYFSEPYTPFAMPNSKSLDIDYPEQLSA